MGVARGGARMTHAGEFRRALCLDCLRAPAFAALKCDAGDPPGLCPGCNGQTCDCNSCLVTIAELEAGNLKPVGIVGLGLASWTAEGGGVEKILVVPA